MSYQPENQPYTTVDPRQAQHYPQQTLREQSQNPYNPYNPSERPSNDENKAFQDQEIHQRNPYYQSQPLIENRQGQPVLTHPVSVMPRTPRGRRAQPFYCDFCKKQEVSQVSYRVGTGGLLFAGVCLFVCFPLSLGPFCVEDCQDAVHTCPRCHREVGKDQFLLD